MDQRKRARIERERLLLADYEAEIIDYTPARYLTYKLPYRFKAFFQFLDPVSDGYWSVEVLVQIDKDNAKIIEFTTRGLSRKRGLPILNGNYIYKHPTEAVTGWQMGLAKNNLLKITAHSVGVGIASFTYNKNGSWTLKGKNLTNPQFQEIRANVATKKRERFTTEKAKEVQKVLDRERKHSKATGAKYRGNEVVAIEFGVSVKTAEVWAKRVSTLSSGKSKTNQKGKKTNAKT